MLLPRRNSQKSKLAKVVRSSLLQLSLACLTLLLTGDRLFAHPREAPGRRTIRAVRVQVEPRIDSVLSDSVWQQADWQDTFVQREPEEGKPGTEATYVAVLYTRRHLLIGVRCDDRHPELIVAREKRRDAILDQDDNFQIVLDTYHDGRTGYYFVINPLGACRDAMLGDEGRNFNPQWDGIWDCRARITRRGWQAEISIPWATLRFPTRDTLTMGINFLRQVRRRDEQQYWQLVPRGQGFFGLARLSQAGLLTGLAGIRGGSWAEFRPYVLAGAQRDPQTAFNTLRQSHVGLDVKLTPSSNVAVDLTWNTDFAQVEADQERVNLTRFSLYYPEKREFFLEGAELFSFGPTGQRHGPLQAGPVQLFYSRRIGLVNGHAVPILGGLRLTGKSGRTRFGVLNITTDRASLGSGVVEPHTNFSAVRIKRDVFSRSTVGAMLLNKQSLDGHGVNRAFGVDATFAPTPHAYLDLAFAGTTPAPGEDSERRPALHNNNLGWYAKAGYRSDFWAFALARRDIESRFNPEMGYLRRPDVRSTSGFVRYMPRPRRFASVRKFYYTLRGEVIHNHRGTTLNRDLTAGFSVRFQNSSRAGVRVDRFYEFLDYNWPVRQGIVVPVGVYRGTTLSVMATGDESRTVIPQVRIEAGDYYAGRRLSVDPQAVVTAFRNLRLDLSASYNRVSLPQGSFTALTSSVRFVLYFSTRLYFKAYLQWRDDPRAAGAKRFGLANLLLRWTVRDGSDLYVVYNEGLSAEAARYRIENRVLLVKFIWFLRV